MSIYLACAIFDEFFDKILAKFSEKIRKFENLAHEKDVEFVDLEKCCKMSIWLQKSASIQPRTRKIRFHSTIYSRAYLPPRFGYVGYVVKDNLSREPAAVTSSTPET